MANKLVRDKYVEFFALCCIVSIIIISLQEVAAVKIDCHPIDGATKEKCEALGCVWEPVKGKHESGKWDNLQPISLIDGANLEPRVNVPWCYFPEDYMGYRVDESTGNFIKLKRVRTSALGSDIENLIVDIKPHDDGKLLRVKIYDADRERFEPELPRLNLAQNAYTTMQEANHHFQVSKTKEMLTITRASTGAILFATDLSKLIYSNQFIQLNSRLSSPLIYGLGEHYDTFLKVADKYKVYSFYNTDRLPLPSGTRSYGGFPFFVNLESTNATHAHGVYLRNSNAMDIILQDDLSITFRPIGGILDFFLFIGPKPLDVTSQYQHLVGLPDLPARWSLGFHLCRYNYGSLERTKLISDRTRNAGIPFDVQWNDIDYMENYNDFTYDHNKYAGLPEFVDQLHKQHMHYIMIVDPGLSQERDYYPYELGNEMNIWVRNATNQTLVSRVWNRSGRTVFPDFSKQPESGDYWSKLFVKFQQEVKFDGAWIDMNDISSFVDGSLDGCPIQSEQVERPPYLPGGYNLQKNTLCLSAQHKAGREYDTHNLYSFYETIATKQALNAARPNRRSLIISRSTHPGQGHFGGHWSGDVQSNWDYLRWSIPSLLEHSMYGFSMIGSDICGFAGNTTPQLCARWSTLGAFYTFSRNHNDEKSIDQDPVALGPDVVNANKNALKKRYSLLPYLYTLIHKAHIYGEPVARAMSFEFFDYNDVELRRVEDQFMWGSGILIAPIVEENVYEKTTYLPKGRWYEANILEQSQSFNIQTVDIPKLINSQGEWHTTKDVALENMPIFYRGGQIIPVYANVKQTVLETVDQVIALEVALCEKGRAGGDIILDDGETADGKTNYIKLDVGGHKVADELTIDLLDDGYMKKVEFGLVKVFGIGKRIDRVELKSPTERNVTFQQKDHMLIFDLKGIFVTKQDRLIVKWL